MIKYKMNKHSEPLFQKSNFSHTPGMISFSNFFITPPKTFQLALGVAGKEVLTLSALLRSCQFLPLSDRTISVYNAIIRPCHISITAVKYGMCSVKHNLNDFKNSKIEPLIELSSI